MENAKLNKVQFEVFENLDSKSKRIRYLLSVGWSRSQIKNKLGILYQFARNVEVASIGSGSLIKNKDGSFSLPK